MLILLQNKGRPKLHINKVRFGYFYCKVKFCVGYGIIFECPGPHIIYSLV
jgi:hypothetical protein